MRLFSNLEVTQDRPHKWDTHIAKLRETITSYVISG